MQNLEVFMSRLLPAVAGCPEPLARQALIDSAIEFCEETRVVQVTSEPQYTSALVGAYDLDLPTGQLAVVTLKAWYGARQLAPAPVAMVPTILAFVSQAGTATPTLGEPQWFFELSPGVISIYPLPDTASATTLSARVATKPTRTATTVEDVLYQDWAEAIVDGAKARLHIIADQSFSSPPHAGMAHARYWQAIGRARSESVRGRVRGSINVSKRAFA